MSGRCDCWRLSGRPIPTRGSAQNDVIWFGGRANKLSIRTVEYPLIDQMHTATKRTTPFEPRPLTTAARLRLCIERRKPSQPDRDFGTVARTRRSALNFRGGASSMSSEDLSTILRAASGVLHADFATTRFIDLYAYVHRVEGVDAGVYRFCWNSGGLELIRAGDQRVVAAGLSLGQDLAGNACTAFSMIGDLERATDIYGDRGYRYVHFEAGAIGQRLYLAAQALGTEQPVSARSSMIGYTNILASTKAEAKSCITSPLDTRWSIRAFRRCEAYLG